jgi:hypothetical protein
MYSSERIGFVVIIIIIIIINNRGSSERIGFIIIIIIINRGIEAVPGLFCLNGCWAAPHPFFFICSTYVSSAGRIAFGMLMSLV